MKLYSRTLISHPKLSLHPVQNEIAQLTPRHQACHLSCFAFSQWNIHPDVVQGTLLYLCTFLSSRLVWCKLFSEIPKNRMCSTWSCMQTNWVHLQFVAGKKKKKEELEKEQPTYHPSHYFLWRGPAKLIQVQGQIRCVCFQMTVGQMLWVYQAREEKGRTNVLALSGRGYLYFFGNWQLIRTVGGKGMLASIPFSQKGTATSTLACN